jgi:hypothetical protein
MRIQVGYELIYDCPQPTPMMLMLHIHHTRAPDMDPLCALVSMSAPVSVAVSRYSLGSR